jgi:putative membrane protein
MEMAVRNFIAAMMTGLLLTALNAPPAGAQQPASLALDSVFIQTAGSVGLLQVKLGKMAEKRGSNAAVVEFGKRMVSDYSKANEAFSAAAKQAAFPAPVLLRQDQQLFDKFNQMGRSSFEKAYMAEMVRQHGEEVRLFQEESDQGRVQSLKQLASTMLPDLQERLAIATQTAGSIGAQVTASAGKAGPESNNR